MLSKKNQIVQSLWIKGRLSNNELLGMYSYLCEGHDFHLYTYSTDIENIPPGVDVKNANELIPQDRLFKDSAGSYAAFADWFRFKLLYEQGNWWVDIDTICIQPLEIDLRYCFSSEMDSLGRTSPNATCMKVPKKSPLLKECLDFIDKRGDDNVRFGEFGLSLFKNRLARYEYMEYVLPSIAFCPINWFNLYQLISKSDYEPSNDTFTIHLWNEIWRRGHLNKDATYHPESIYERLKKKYIK